MSVFTRKSTTSSASAYEQKGQRTERRPERSRDSFVAFSSNALRVSEGSALFNIPLMMCASQSPAVADKQRTEHVSYDRLLPCP